jgi:hypothetical protein
MVQEEWKRGNIAAAMLMDVKGAFLSVAKANLIQTMEDMKFEADLCRWVESLMSDRKVRIKMDGRMEKVMDVETRVTQGSPTSPILFAIYIAGHIKTAENKVPEVTTLSFVDDVAWVVEGRDINQLTSQMQRCVRRATKWVEVNTVQFSIAKTEAVLFSTIRNHQGNNVKRKIQVDKNNLISFNSKPTRWLGVWMDKKLNFQHHHQIVMTKVKKGQGRVKGITGRLGLKPENAKKVQLAAVQSVALYG